MNFSETCPEFNSYQWESVRDMPVSEKFRIMEELILRAQHSIQHRLRVLYPQASADEIQRRFATV